MGSNNDKVIQFLPWARRFARSCSVKLPPHLDHEDLQAAGIQGYVRAASRYHASGGASFRSYCALRIQGAVLDEVRHWDWAPRTVHRNNRRVTGITAKLWEQLNREPTTHELALALGVEDDEIAAILASVQPRQMVSFDEVTENQHGEETLALAERLADPTAPPPDACMRANEHRRVMARCIRRLPKTQATVIVLHYLQYVPLREVAQLLHVTPSRVSQLHRRGLDRLKQLWPSALQRE